MRLKNTSSYVIICNTNLINPLFSYKRFVKALNFIYKGLNVAKAAIAINESELSDMGTLLKKMEDYPWSKTRYKNNYKLVAGIICGS